MIDYLIDIDTQFFLFLNALNTEVMDPVMVFVSKKWPWIPMYIAIAAAVIWRYGWKKGIILVLAIGACVGLADFVCASVIRPMVQRMRPANLQNPICELVHIVDGYRGGRYGFPSCHAANTFALACASSIVLKWRPYIAFIFCWAILQCYSRIYLGVHYPGDLLVGAIIGAAIGCLMLAFLRKPA